MRLFGLLWIVLSAVVSVASAQSTLPITGPVKATPATVRVMLASLLVSQDVKGQEVLTPTSERVHPRPGDLLAWQATAINDMSRGVSDLMLTIPVPVSTLYVGGSAQLRLGGMNVAPLFSLDGQTFAPAPLKRKVSVVRNGVTSLQEVTVPPSEYRAVRWVLPALATHAQAIAELRTTVR